MLIVYFDKYYHIQFLFCVSFKFSTFIFLNILPLDEGVRMINTLCEKMITLDFVSGDHFFPRVLIYLNIFIQGQCVYIIIDKYYHIQFLFCVSFKFSRFIFLNEEVPEKLNAPCYSSLCRFAIFWFH
jgi:hypothetical protein